MAEPLVVPAAIGCHHLVLGDAVCLPCPAERPSVLLSASEASQILRFPFASLRASAQNDRVECSAERQQSVSLQLSC